MATVGMRTSWENEQCLLQCFALNDFIRALKSINSGFGILMLHERLNQSFRVEYSFENSLGEHPVKVFESENYIMNIFVWYDITNNHWEIRGRYCGCVDRLFDP